MGQFESDYLPSEIRSKLAADVEGAKGHCCRVAFGGQIPEASDVVNFVAHAVTPPDGVARELYWSRVVSEVHGYLILHPIY
jgi:hypothetical protein